MAARITRAAALLLLGLYAGGVVFSVLAPGVYELPGPAYVRYWQALNLDYGAAMPVLLLSCIALLITTAVLSRSRSGLVLWLTVAATALVVLTVVLTVSQMEPLNRLADSWDPDLLPEDWADVRDLWRNWHLVRTVLALLAFASLLTSQAVDTPTPARAAVPSAVG